MLRVCPLVRKVPETAAQTALSPGTVMVVLAEVPDSGVAQLASE
jgi:hypothetical protein